MNLTIQRDTFNDKATLGELLVDGLHECFTLEDKVREVPGQPVSQWKIPGQTAIPQGTYRVTVDFSNRFHKPMPHVLDVPGFDGIRIHPGTTDADTEGCVLLGQARNGDDQILQSRLAFNAFFPKLVKALGLCILLPNGEAIQDFDGYYESIPASAVEPDPDATQPAQEVWLEVVNANPPQTDSGSAS